MKKLFTLLIIISVCFTKANAQKIVDTLLSESFEGAATGWTVANTCGDKWYLFSSAADGTKSIGYASYTCPGFLYSPKITPTDVAKEDSFKLFFSIYRSDAHNDDYLNVNIMDGDGLSSLQGPFVIERNNFGAPAATDTGWIGYEGKWAASDFLDSKGSFKLSFEAVSNGYYIVLDKIEVIIIRDNAVKLTYLSPLGGESYYNGQKVSVKWNSNSSNAMSYKVIGTQNASVLASGSGTLDQDSFKFTVPPTTTEENFIVQIKDEVSGKYYESKSFNVVEPLAITNPMGGETFYWGQQIVLKWNSRADNETSFKLKSVDGSTLDSWIGNMGATTYNYTIPMTSKSGFYFEGVDKLTSQVVKTDTFSIVKPKISFLSPSQGDKFQAGDQINIQWSTKGIKEVNPNATIELQLIDKNDNLIKSIDKNLSFSDGSYNWTVPAYYGEFRIEAIFNNSALGKEMKYPSELFSIEKNTGISTLHSNSNELQIYPNPSNGNFKLYLPQGAEKSYTLNIYSIEGKHVLSKEINRDLQEVAIDLSGFKGVYTIILKSEKGVYQKQVTLL